MFLQVFGVSTVAIGVSRTRRQFGLPGLFASVLHWFQAFPRCKRGFITVSGTSQMPDFGQVAGVQVDPFPPGRSLDRRVDDLEHRTQQLREDLAEKYRELSERLERSLDALRGEQYERSRNIEETRELVKSAHTDGEDLTLMGAVWILFGVLWATAPVEILDLYMWLKGLFASP